MWLPVKLLGPLDPPYLDLSPSYVKTLLWGEGGALLDEPPVFRDSGFRVTRPWGTVSPPPCREPEIGDLEQSSFSHHLLLREGPVNSQWAPVLQGCDLKVKKSPGDCLPSLSLVPPCLPAAVPGTVGAERKGCL